MVPARFQRLSQIQALRWFSICLSLALFHACQPSAKDQPREILVRVGSLGLDPVTETPVVILKEKAGERSLPIWIGVSEARSIATELEELEAPRPNTHDLAKRLLGSLEAPVERVVVTKLDEGIYYAVIELRNGEKQIEIDARPSDAIAIALRVEAPVFVREGLFQADAEGISDAADPEELRL